MKIEAKENKITDRSYKFAIDIISMVKKMPKDIASVVLARQVIRSGTSVGANVEEAQGASSKKDFINKMNISKKEARETKYWLRLIKDSSIIQEEEVNNLINESNELISILTAIVKTSTHNL